ncbi:type II secretion system F family protein [uncultured Campylobacter sp.]|uniref:type II secretion system F family protein n=1 Tax=uncultured Campylobacter sp. TaxID=218934 RepID=UPI00261A715F|nr:type II secretion system F family protein [uncultured Campylobacter sp.]
MRYRVKLYNSDKEIIIYAKSKFQAQKIAINKGLKVENIEEANNIFFKKRLKDSILLIFYKELSILLDSNISLQNAIKELEKSAKSDLKIFLNNISKLLNSGQNLTSAFKNSSFYFNNTELTLLELAEHSGELAKIFAKLCELKEKKIENLKKLKKALSYPCFVFITLIFAFCAIILLILPQFKNLFNEFNIELPLITRMFLNFYDCLSEFYLVIIFAFVAFIFIFILLYKNRQDFAYIVDMIISKIPIVSSLIFYSQSSQFFFVLSVLSEANIVALKSVKLASANFQNKFIKQKIKEIQILMEQGLSLELAFDKVKIFDTLVISMLNTAMKSAKLGKICENISRYYEVKLDDKLSLILNLIEPLMTFVVAIGVLFLALGIFLPMWELNSINKF